MCLKIKTIVQATAWPTEAAMCYADKPETIDDLKNNIREAIGEIQLHTIDNVLKIERIVQATA